MKRNAVADGYGLISTLRTLQAGLTSIEGGVDEVGAALAGRGDQVATDLRVLSDSITAEAGRIEEAASEV